MLKQSPFPTFTEFLRALAKALVLVVLINVLLLALNINPVRAVVGIHLWGLASEGRQRLVYPGDLQNGILPIEVQLRSHALNRPKAEDEYRVLVLGDSGILGWGLPDEETLSAQLTAADIEVDGRRVVAYNLAYPQPYVPRDVIIIDAALRYDPDLILWTVTAAAFNNDPQSVLRAQGNRLFFMTNEARVEAVLNYYPTEEWQRTHAALIAEDDPAWERYVAIRDRDLLGVWVNALFYPIIPPGLGETDERIGDDPLPEEAQLMDNAPGFEQMPNPTWNFLDGGCTLTREASVALLLVNRPILVGSGENSDTVYNRLYGRDFYDRYRTALAGYTAQQDIPYVDLWDAIPARNYTDSPLHADGEGYGILAADLTPILEDGIPLCD